MAVRFDEVVRVMRRICSSGVSRSFSDEGTNSSISSSSKETSGIIPKPVENADAADELDEDGFCDIDAVGGIRLKEFVAPRDMASPLRDFRTSSFCERSNCINKLCAEGPGALTSM